MNLQSPKVFYGWWIVGASFLIALYVGGVVFYGFTAIFEPIANELGWSYTQISVAASLRGMEVGLLAPLVGILVDRWGPRRLIFIGAVITALGLVLLGRITSLGMFYGAFALVAIGMSCCTMTVLMTAVANWFQRNVGIATGIAVSGFGFGGLLILVIVRLIEVYEWRMTVVMLGLGMLVIVMPLSLMFRHKPEHYGYLPDGEVRGVVVLDDCWACSQTIGVDATAGQAVRSSAFWHLAVAFTCHIMMISAIATHVMPYLSSIGVIKSKSSLVATAIPLMSIGGRLGLGWLGDKFDRRMVTAVAFAMMGFGVLCFGYVSTAGVWLLVPFIILFGMGYGGGNALRPSLGREFFGRSSFGSVFGLLVGINMLGGVVGPPLAGWVFDNWGSYQYIWFLFACLAVVALISVLTVGPKETQMKDTPTTDHL